MESNKISQSFSYKCVTPGGVNCCIDAGENFQQRREEMEHGLGGYGGFARRIIQISRDLTPANK